MNKVYSYLGMLFLMISGIANAQTYCTPTFTTGCGIGDQFTNVTFVNINSTITTCPPGSYTDTTSQYTNINQTLSYTASITNNPTYGQGIGVFMDWNGNGSFADAGEFFSNANVTPASGVENIAITVPAGATLGNTRMRVICTWNTPMTATGSCGGTTYGRAEDFNLTILPAPPCPPVGSLSISNLTATGVDLNWTAGAGAIDYTVEWGLNGFAPGTGAQTGMVSAVTGLTTPVTGLAGQTNYQFYVQSNCGGVGVSPWQGPFSFTTPCTAYLAPYYENFTTSVTPLCWSQSATTGGPWTFTGNPGYDVSGTLDHTNGSANNYAWIDHSGTDAGVILESPLIDVSALNVPEVRFWIVSHYTGSLTTYNPTFVEAWDGTAWQLLGVVQGEYGPAWTEFNFIVPPAMIFNTNFVQIRLRAESGGESNDFNNDILLDDFSVIEAPTCPQPILLTVDQADTSSAIFSWTSTGSETQWYLEYGPVGFTPGTGTSVIFDSNPDTITGLTPSTFYHAYIRAYCTPGDTSFYTGPVLFNTYGLGIYMEANNDCHPNGFMDISLTGTTDDLLSDGTSSFATPFDMYFQGGLVANYNVSNNGVLLFGNTATFFSGFNNNTIGTNAATGLYPFWDDLQDNGGPVYWEVQGTAPNQRFIVQWEKKHDLYQQGDTLQFQVVLEQATGEIYYNYKTATVGSTTYDYGNNATIGLKGINQNFPLSYNNSAYLENNTCVKFYYTDCPKPANLIVDYVLADEVSLSWTAGIANESNWTIIYGPTGFDPTTGGTTITTTSATANVIAGLSQNTVYDFYVYGDCSPTLQSFDIMTTVNTLPFCSNPSGISTNTAIDSVFTAWNWTTYPGGAYPATGFNLQYGDFGFVNGTGTVIANTDLTAPYDDTTFNAAFLSGGVYQMYVQAVCGVDTSSYIGPFAFTMPLTNDSVCGAEMLPVDGIARSFDNTGATIQANESAIAPPATGAQTTDGWLTSNVDFTTWFTFVAPASGNMRLSGVDAGFNGQMAVYSAASCSPITSLVLEGANDDEIGGTSSAPNFTVCGLTPGVTYFLMHDSFSTSATGIYSIKLSAINLDAGSTGTLIDACLADTIDLFNGISGQQPGGTWLDTDGTFHIVNNNFFNTNGLASGTYNFEYRLEDGCAYDSTMASVKIYPPSSAGTGGNINICKNQPTSLLPGLSGNVDLGGTWTDPNGGSSTGSIATLELFVAGNYNYTYIVGNGVCPADTAVVTVIVSNTCDFLALEDLELSSLNVYPNPTTGLLNIIHSESQANLDIRLIDARGAVVFEQKAGVIADQLFTLDISKFEDGVYILNLQNGELSTNLRVVKK